MTKTLYLMRHGQTFFNKYHKIQGRVDSPLTELGIEQAKKARQKLIEKEEENFNLAYSSTSERASDTLEIVTDYKMPYKRLKGLREMAFGVFEAQDESLNPTPPYHDYFGQFGGEKQSEVEKRMYSTITPLMHEAHDGDKVLVVSHGGACMSFLRQALHKEKPLPLHYPNCGIAVLDFEDDGDVYTLREVIAPDGDWNK